MYPQNPVKRSRTSTWLMSLVILLSLIGFSASAETRMEQKEVETENTFTGKPSLNRGASFKRLQWACTSANFFTALSKVSTAYLQDQYNQLTRTGFLDAAAKCKSFTRPHELIRRAYLARSADELLFS